MELGVYWVLSTWEAVYCGGGGTGGGDGDRVESSPCSCSRRVISINSRTLSMLRTNSSRVAASADAAPKLADDPPDTFVSASAESLANRGSLSAATGVGVGVSALTGVLSRLSVASRSVSVSVSASVSASVSLLSAVVVLVLLISSSGRWINRLASVSKSTRALSAKAAACSSSSSIRSETLLEAEELRYTSSASSDWGTGCFVTGSSSQGRWALPGTWSPA